MDFWGSAHPHRFCPGRTRAGAGIKNRALSPKNARCMKKTSNDPNVAKFFVNKKPAEAGHSYQSFFAADSATSFTVSTISSDCFNLSLAIPITSLPKSGTRLSASRNSAD